MSRKSDVNTGLECRDVEIWREGGVYKYYTKIWIAIYVSRYKNCYKQFIEGAVSMLKMMCNRF